jgi:hypothetical protein
MERQGMVVSMMHIRLAAVVVAFALTVGCAAGEVRLADPVSCSGLETIRLGAEREVVLAAVGTPFRSGPRHAVQRSGSLAYDQAARYGSIMPDMGFHFWDTFDIYFLEGKVVGANATRSYGDTRDAPGGVEPGPVFWVRRGPDRTEERGVGPLFKDVFGCDPPATITASK